MNNNLADSLIPELRWMVDAACLYADPDMFFPADGVNAAGYIERLCGPCKVREKCLWYSNEIHASEGWFGGMSPAARERWRRENGIQLGDSRNGKSTRVYEMPECLG